MPPHNTYPSFEEIEAKEWASNTIRHILTDISPVTFETTEFPSKRPQLEIQTSYLEKDNSHLRRSFSILEGSLLASPKKDTRNSRRSQSTLLPSIADASKSTTTTRSAPTTPTNKLSPQPSFSSRIKHTWHMDRASVKQLFVVSDKKSSREQKGITTWKLKYKEYMSHPPKSLHIVPKPSSKRSIQLSKFIMSELLTTEETYLNHLLTIKNIYMDPLIEAATSTAQKKTSLVNLKDIEIIFAYIPQLISLSTTLVQQLYDTVSQYLEDDTDNNQVSIGKIFCDLESYFEIYISYAVNFPRSRKHLTKASSNISYRQLIQDTMRKKDSNRMLLSDYMIAPIQRITRYCLLLTDLQKHSNKANPDYAYLQKALMCLSALAYAMNTIQ